MENELKAHLRALIDAFCGISPLSPKTIWGRAVGDARFFQRIEAGHGFSVRTYDKAVQWFSDNWPEDAVWPPEVPRPVSGDEP